MDTGITLKGKLKRLFDEDKNERINIDWNDQEAKELMRQHDWERRKKVQGLISNGLLKEADGEIYYQLSLILQHGETPEDYWQAHEYAKKAFESGVVGSGRMVANTLDRYLKHIGEPQKYGTQSRWNEEQQRYIQYPVSLDTTDEERFALGLPSLEVLKEEIMESTKFRTEQKKRKIPPQERIKEWSKKRKKND
ncbi:MAG TPA: hypothetical protein VMW04_00610 [Patescibacteria group bacterium]|nr:hypothetical protein [Patescibacteria group bacterium]